MAHAYDVGTKAWQTDASEGWVASEVVSKKVHGDQVILIFELENGEVSRPWRIRRTDRGRGRLTATDQDRRDHAGHPPRR